MNLTKDPKNPDRLKADLDTIQRSYGIQQGLITQMQAQIAILQAATTLGGPIIQPNSTVRTFKKQNGDPTVPFGGATPVTVPPQLVQLVNIPTAAIGVGNFFGRNTTPLTLVPAVAGVTHFPISCYFYSKITGAGGAYVNGATTWELVFQGNVFGTLFVSAFSGTMGWNAAPAAGNFSRSFQTLNTFLNTNNVQNPAFGGVGKALQLQSAADVSGGSNGVAGLSLYYVDIADNVY